MLVTERSLRKWSEQYLKDSDCMKLEIDEMELLLGPEDSEVNLTHILRNAGRRGGRIFEIFDRKKRVSTQLQAKCDGMSARC